MEIAFIYQGEEEKDQTEIPSNYNIKKFPSMVVYKDENTKVDHYKEEFKYKQMFEFLNVYSQ